MQEDWGSERRGLANPMFSRRMKGGRGHGAAHKEGDTQGLSLP